MRYNKPVQFVINKEILVADYIKAGYTRQDVLSFIKYLIAHKLIAEKQPKTRFLAFDVVREGIIGKQVIINVITTKEIPKNYKGKPTNEHIENLLTFEKETKMADENNDVKVESVSPNNDAVVATDSNNSNAAADKAAAIALMKAQIEQVKKENIEILAKIDKRSAIFPPRFWDKYADIIAQDLTNLQTIENPKYKLYMFENFIFASFSETGYDSPEAAFNDIWAHIEDKAWAPYHYWETTEEQNRANMIADLYIKILIPDPPEGELATKVTHLPA